MNNKNMNRWPNQVNRCIYLIDAIDLILDFNKNENESVNENDNVNDKTLMSSENDDETMSQNEIKKLNDYFDKMIDKSKSFEDQIKSFKKVENLDEYYSIYDFDDKELKSKIFKLKLGHLSNIIDKKLFKTIFRHTFETSASKLINTTNKEENQIIVKNINANKKKITNKKKRSLMIGLSNQVIDAII